MNLKEINQGDVFYIVKDNNIYGIKIDDIEQQSYGVLKFYFYAGLIYYNYDKEHMDFDYKTFIKEFPGIYELDEDVPILAGERHLFWSNFTGITLYKSLEEAEKFLLKNKQSKTLKVGKYYQCIENWSIFNKEINHPLNIVKIIEYDPQGTAKVICPNHTNTTLVFNIPPQYFKNFKPYQYEQVHSESSPIAGKSQPNTSSTGCERNFSANRIGQAFDPERIDFLPVTISSCKIRGSVILGIESDYHPTNQN